MMWSNVSGKSATLSPFKIGGGVKIGFKIERGGEAVKLS